MIIYRFGGLIVSAYEALVLKERGKLHSMNLIPILKIVSLKLFYIFLFCSKFDFCYSRQVPFSILIH